jgi:hypothetical protein
MRTRRKRLEESITSKEWKLNWNYINWWDYDYPIPEYLYSKKRYFRSKPQRSWKKHRKTQYKIKEIE